MRMMTDTDANLEYIAERLSVDCSSCHGDGIQHGYRPILDVHCPDCQGSGKRWLLRVDCRHMKPNWSHMSVEYYDECPKCAGHGYTPVTDMALILEACKLKGWEADVGTDMEFGYNASVWHGESRHTPTPDVFEYGDTPLDALTLAIRRAIEAVE